MDWKLVESRQNPTVKYIASLSDKKERDREGVFLAEGFTLLSDLKQAGIFPRKVFLSTAFLSRQQEAETCVNESCACYLLSPAAFERVTSEKGSEGVVSLYSKSDLPSFPETGVRRLVALENVQDPGNVGTILRSAASFGFDGVLLCGCADVFGARAVRASMGALARIPVKVLSDSASMMDLLDKMKMQTVAACLGPTAKSIAESDLSEPVCVLLGNEGKGLSSFVCEHAHKQCIIPIRRMESLNVASAASIFLWEIDRRGGIR